jgi:hypothetical protein
MVPSCDIIRNGFNRTNKETSETIPEINITNIRED